MCADGGQIWITNAIVERLYTILVENGFAAVVIQFIFARTAKR
jgi:hypothetical protein